MGDEIQLPDNVNLQTFPKKYPPLTHQYPTTHPDVSEKEKQRTAEQCKPLERVKGT